ncbi:MAG: Plug domain-containing protein, partial [Deltaproteobacteria bacterium]|nr:Plug domain-containing protein [Deltaproteobacteria bacterium]
MPGAWIAAFALVADAQEITEARLLAPVTPTYPDAALVDRPSGSVVVHCTVDVEGVVVDAVVASGGPDVFFEAAIDAARALRFAAATRDGAPVESHVHVTFVFAPPPAPPDEADLEIVVIAPSAAELETHAVTTLGEAELARSSGQDLGQTLGNVPGVTAARGTSDATKPIIRGQVERRLLVLFDGVRHESQKWGLDHATEID